MITSCRAVSAPMFARDAQMVSMDGDDSSTRRLNPFSFPDYLRGVYVVRRTHQAMHKVWLQSACVGLSKTQTGPG